ncbi:unnamed protein product [Orchesella dallaii]|uniref:Uncharacterized protein n=1 Tax=Orchesella dallaii TaxID=48710 RepID=A0ABP1R6J3_9HEXA
MKRRPKKKEPHSHQQNQHPNSGKEREELTAGTRKKSKLFHKVLGSEPAAPSVSKGADPQRTTSVREVPAKSLLQQPSAKTSEPSRNNAKRRAYFKARYQQKMSSAAKKEEMRANWRHYYHQRKANGKVQKYRVESEAQKERRRMRWKANETQRKENGKKRVLSDEQKEKERARSKINYYKRKEKKAAEREQMLEEEPMKSGRESPASKR